MIMRAKHPTIKIAVRMDRIRMMAFVNLSSHEAEIDEHADLLFLRLFDEPVQDPDYAAADDRMIFA